MRLYGVLPGGPSSSPINSRTALCWREWWWCTFWGRSGRWLVLRVQLVSYFGRDHTVLSSGHPFRVHAVHRLRHASFSGERGIGLPLRGDGAGARHVRVGEGIGHTRRGCFSVVNLRPRIRGNGRSSATGCETPLLVGGARAQRREWLAAS